ncbi:proline and serine-rich protein 3 isoform 2-T2 [Pholidichthys leucotaenia]
MKSSHPVFTRQNPFPPASKVRRSHYHPSGNQSPSKKEKKLTLSSLRPKERSNPQLQPLRHGSHPESTKNDYSPTDGDPVFMETWPSADSDSSSGSNNETPEQSRPVKSTVSSVQGPQDDSVLAKYIDRFRHGRPQSREERQQEASALGVEGLPYWWMSHSPTSSTPTKMTGKDIFQPLKDDNNPVLCGQAGQLQCDKAVSPCRSSCSVLSDISKDELNNEMEILHLQEKANRLLLKGECTLSDGSVPVSSDGVGCSDFSSPVIADEPVQQSLIPSLIKATTEEDILFQWRLRRKMEQAREGSLQPSSLHTFSWHATSLRHSLTSGQAYKDQPSTQPPQFLQRDTNPHTTTTPQPESIHAQTSCSSIMDPPHPLAPAAFTSSSVSQPHVPAHMHLLCDVLPCPVQSSHSRVNQSISQELNESKAKVHKKMQAPDILMKSNDLHNKQTSILSPLLPASSGAIEEQWSSHQKIPERNRKHKSEIKESEKTEKEIVTSRQQKKPARSSSQKLPKKIIPCKEGCQMEGSQEFSKMYSDDHKPPPSPVHSALGQVVSEVLFSSTESPGAQRIPKESLSSPRFISDPLQPSAPPCNPQNSMEVISQLLQEAEDSDEKEFEDDPLLQVLRTQRRWVKEQISEVDSVLSEFPEDQHVK